MKEGTCFECSRHGEVQDHHVVPRSLGGTKTVPLCPRCHSLVHNQNLDVRALQKKGLRGAWEGGKRWGQAPYGYDLKDGKLSPNKPEMKWLSWMKARRDEGKGYAWIARELNNRSVSTKQKGKWAPCTIRWLFKKRPRFPYV